MNKPYIYRKQIKHTKKFYIGKHNGKNKEYKGSGIDWLNDYKLYVKNPKEDLITEILEYVNDVTKLNEREEYWLKLVDAEHNPLYYNLTNNSYGLTIHNELSKQKMSNSKKGKVLSNITKKRISKAKKGKPLSQSHIDSLKGIKKPGVSIKKIGFKHTNKSKRKMSKSHLGKKGTNNIPVNQYDKQGNFIKEWENGRKAEMYYSNRNNNVSISAVCNNKQKTAFGFIWKFK